MKQLLPLLFLMLAVPLCAQEAVHDGEIADNGLYIGKHSWHDAATELPVAEVIYDPSGVLLSYKTWVDGDIMDAEVMDTDRDRETLPAKLEEVVYEKDGWGIARYNATDAQRVQKGQKVSVRYKGWLQDGTVFEDGMERGKPFRFVTGKQQVIPGFERAVLALAPGEGAYVVIPPALAYRGNAIGTIPPYAVLRYQIEVVEVK